MSIHTNLNSSSPLKKFWNIISTILGVVSLVSFTDRLIAWKNFIPELIQVYKKIAYTPFRFLDINLSEVTIDYLFIGVLCGMAYVKAIDFGEKNGILNTFGNPKGVRIMYFIMYLFLWPVGILVSLKQVLLNEPDVSEKLIKTNFISWLGTLLLGFVIILILNSLF